MNSYMISVINQHYTYKVSIAFLKYVYFTHKGSTYKFSSNIIVLN